MKFLTVLFLITFSNICASTTISTNLRSINSTNLAYTSINVPVLNVSTSQSFSFISTTATTIKTTINLTTQNSFKSSISPPLTLSSIPTTLPDYYYDYPVACLYGYTGNNCDIQTDWCTPQICLNVSFCTNYTTYDCNCINGTCKIQNAIPSILNGANCFDLSSYNNLWYHFNNFDNQSVNFYRCGCKNNFGKQGRKVCQLNNCQVNTTNPCSSESSCLSSAALNGGSILYCSCIKGQNCFKNSLNPCSVNQCANNSICTGVYSQFRNYFQNAYLCQCNSSLSQNCYNSADPCFLPKNQCQNGGTCVSFLKQNSSFCLCPQGTTGSYCQTFIDCLLPNANGPSACNYNGTCIQTLNNYYLNKPYTCNCRPGHTGTYCDQCSSSPCLNGGSCSFNKTGSIQCICPYGYQGNFCEIRYDSCQFSNDIMCDTNNTCSAYKNYYCNCNSSSNSTCQLQYCSFDKGCVDSGKSCLPTSSYQSYGCSCNFYNMPLSVNRTNGQCKISNINTCDMNVFTTFNFQTNSLDYRILNVNNTCKNGAKCSFGFDSFQSYYSYFCQCSNGKQCMEWFDPCQYNLCNQNSTCMAYSNMFNSYYCNCNQSSVSEQNQCVKQNHPCFSSPCQNGGICLAVLNTTMALNSTQTYNCVCPIGTYGNNCQYLNNYCAYNFCGSNGTCAMVGVGKFKCNCKPGSTGLFCESSFSNLNSTQTSTILPLLSNLTSLGSTISVIKTTLKTSTTSTILSKTTSKFTSTKHQNH